MIKIPNIFYKSDILGTRVSAILVTQSAELFYSWVICISVKLFAEQSATMASSRITFYRAWILFSSGDQLS
jgi:hypothetical protein